MYYTKFRNYNLIKDKFVKLEQKYKLAERFKRGNPYYNLNSSLNKSDFSI